MDIIYTFDAKLLRLAQSCQAHMDVRKPLNGILLAQNGDVVGTDGHTMFKSTCCAEVQQDVIVNLHKDIPKTADLIHLNMTTLVAQCSRVLANGKSKDTTVIPFEVVDATYPDYKRFLPTKTEPTEFVGLNARYLARAALFGDYGSHGGVKICLNTDSGSIVFRPAGIEWPAGTLMFIMPMRL